MIMKYFETRTVEVKAYTAKLNKAMVDAFEQMMEIYLETRKGVKVRNLNLTYSQYSNFQKLRYFDLMFFEDSQDVWYPTQLGIAFFFGEFPVLDPAGHMDNQPLPRDHPAWDTHSKGRRKTYIHDVDRTHFKQRSDYQAEASTGPTLFDIIPHHA